jgi:hypothetical protein
VHCKLQGGFNVIENNSMYGLLTIIVINGSACRYMLL